MKTPPEAPRLARARCLVTGGSRNLGRALCLALARAGARVAFPYQRRTPEAEETRAALERLGCETRVFQGDVTDGAHARKVVGDLVAAWDGVDRVSELPVPFAASKGALAAMTRALAREVGRYGIRVNSMSPGLCEEGMGARLHGARRDDYRRLASLGRLGTLDEIAAFAAWLVSPENTFMSGANINVDGGL